MLTCRLLGSKLIILINQAKHLRVLFKTKIGKKDQDIWQDVQVLRPTKIYGGKYIIHKYIHYPCLKFNIKLLESFHSHSHLVKQYGALLVQT